MTVSVAGFVESLRTGTSDPMEWLHNQGVTAPKGVLVAIIHGASSTDHVVSVSYGSASLQRIQRNVDTNAEMGAAEWWFVGTSIPTGNQTVSVDLSSATTDDIHGVSITLDGAADLSISDFDGISEQATNPSVTLQYGGKTSMAFAAFYSGLTAHTSITAGTDCTKFTTSELSGNFTSCCIRQTTAGSADFAIAATAAGDDVAFACVAVTDVVTTQTTKTQTALARITKTIDRTQNAKASVLKTADRSQVARASILHTIDQEQTSVARLNQTIDQTQSATARVQRTMDQTQTAIASIESAAILPIPTLVTAPYTPQ